MAKPGGRTPIERSHPFGQVESPRVDLAPRTNEPPVGNPEGVRDYCWHMFAFQHAETIPPAERWVTEDMVGWRFEWARERGYDTILFTRRPIGEAPWDPLV